MGSVKDYIRHHYRHFNSAVVIDAAAAWEAHIDAGGQMLLTLAGAMSTAELGVSVAELIREGKVHALSVTGANLEEDVFNLVAHDSYVRIPEYRELTPQQEAELRDKGLHRVTDTCIPEDEALLKIQGHMSALWTAARDRGERYFPHEYFYQLLLSGVLKDEYQIDPKHSWLLAAAERNLPIFVPGWEDSTLGMMFVAEAIRGTVDIGRVKTGLEYTEALVNWYREADAHAPIGFFQIGGGISGDFPICGVPLMRIDLEWDVRYWAYFCQISDSTTSYGSYSGAVPNEKITWSKLDTDTPSFVIESDATIVFPLIAAYLLDA